MVPESPTATSPLGEHVTACKERVTPEVCSTHSSPVGDDHIVPESPTATSRDPVHATPFQSARIPRGACRAHVPVLASVIGGSESPHVRSGGGFSSGAWSEESDGSRQPVGSDGSRQPTGSGGSMPPVGSDESRQPRRRMAKRTRRPEHQDGFTVASIGTAFFMARSSWLPYENTLTINVRTHAHSHEIYPARRVPKWNPPVVSAPAGFETATQERLPTLGVEQGQGNSSGSTRFICKLQRIHLCHIFLHILLVPKYTGDFRAAGL